jgi:hypothetical protein
VDSAGHWKTLQFHLKSARAAREAGNIPLALQELDAALSIDPEYLAARVLRESIAHRQTLPPAPAQPSSAPPAEPQSTAAVPISLPEATPAAAPAPIPATAPTATPTAASTATPAAAPTAVPPSLEERVRRRRIVLRIGAAQTAILLGRFAEARIAIDELIELEPGLPTIPELVAELSAARVHSKRKRLMLVAGVAAGVAGAYIGSNVGRVADAHRQWWSASSRAPLFANAIPMFYAGIPDAAPTLSADLFDPGAATAPVLPTVTREEPRPPRVPDDAAEVVARVETPASRDERVSDARFVERPPAAAVVERPSVAPVPVERAPEVVPAVARNVVPPPVAQPAVAVDDPALIRDTLQRYRRAYNALDARLAHAVYPGVDETALTHAFEGLRSQSLEFEACSVDSLGASARAVCRGQARYVTKIGSREPRSEPRVWTFRLRKDDGDWTIESAWTNR